MDIYVNQYYKDLNQYKYYVDQLILSYDNYIK